MEISRQGRIKKNILNIFENMENKTVIDISCSGISDIDGLENVQIIKQLLAYDNTLTDLSALQSFSNLEVVHLQYNGIERISGIFRNLTKLKELRLDTNDINFIDSSEFINCLNLTVLNVGYNKLHNIEFIRCIPSLKELIICHNFIKSLDDIKYCKQLVDLDASMNQLIDVRDALNGCLVLNTLKMSKNQINTLCGLSTLKMMSCFDISYNQIDSIAAIALACPNLEYLDVRKNEITNAKEILMSVELLKSLREFRIEENPLNFAERGFDKSEFHEKLLELVQSIDEENEYTSEHLTKKTILTLENTDAEVINAIEDQFSKMRAIYDIFDKRMASCHNRIQKTFKEMPAENFWISSDSSNEQSALIKPPNFVRSRRLKDALEFSKTDSKVEESDETNKTANTEVNKFMKLFLKDQLSIEL